MFRWSGVCEGGGREGGRGEWVGGDVHNNRGWSANFFFLNKFQTGSVHVD